MKKMNGPHCGGAIPLFSKKMARVAGSKACPACGQGVRLSLALRHAAFVFLPVAVFGILVTRHTPLACGVAAAVAACMGLGLKAD